MNTVPKGILRSQHCDDALLQFVLDTNLDMRKNTDRKQIRMFLKKKKFSATGKRLIPSFFPPQERRKIMHRSLCLTRGMQVCAPKHTQKNHYVIILLPDAAFFPPA